MKKKEKAIEEKEIKLDRRNFFKHSCKFLLGFSAFGIAFFNGLKRNGEIRLGKMKNVDVGLSEAYGTCGGGLNCSGGGGQCGGGLNCSGGGGQCGGGLNCSGS